MKTLAAAIVLICLGLVAGAGQHGNNVEQAFADHKIVPDVINEPPSKLLKIEYPNTHKEALLGNELAPKDVRQPPKVTYDADPHSFYTLMLVDPDAPNPKNPVNKEWQHWLVGNIPGADISKGDTIIEYVGSAPPKNGGIHRYILLVYKQPQKLTFDEPRRSNRDGQRSKFAAQNFAQKYKLGRPLAGNFFMAKYDESVPETHRQFRH